MHCVSAITNALQALDGVSKVEVDLEARTVAVTHDATKVTLTQLTETIEEQGYEIIE